MERAMNIKMPTPEYILDIRQGKYSKSAAISEILKRCNINSLPVNVWKIARHMNFEVLEADFKEDNYSGMMIDALEVPKTLSNLGVKRAIILNRKEEKSMQSFTVAHELAHFIFDCDEKTNCFDAYHICREKNEHGLNEVEIEKKEVEDERDKFAAMLLMPELMFLQYINSSPNRSNREMLKKEMAKVCMVEEVAIEKRFDELGVTF